MPITGAALSALSSPICCCKAWASPLISCRFFYAWRRSECFAPITKESRLAKTVAYAILLLSLGVILSVVIDTESARDAGGIIGGFLNESVLVPLFGRLSAVLIACFTMLLSVMVLTQHSLFDLIGHTKKSFVDFRKSFVPAINNRLKEFKDKSDKRKGENTKKEKKDYIPPPIVLKDEVKDDPTAKKLPKKPALAAGAIQAPGDWRRL